MLMMVVIIITIIMSSPSARITLSVPHKVQLSCGRWWWRCERESAWLSDSGEAEVILLVALFFNFLSLWMDIHQHIKLENVAPFPGFQRWRLGVPGPLSLSVNHYQHHAKLKNAPVPHPPPFHIMSQSLERWRLWWLTSLSRKLYPFKPMNHSASSAC